jgi:hypothetical protein
MSLIETPSHDREILLSDALHRRDLNSLDIDQIVLNNFIDSPQQFWSR